MKKKLAVLLVVTMLMSLLPAHMVLADTSTGSTIVSTASTVPTVFPPRSAQSQPFMAFAATASEPWQVTTGASVTITATPQPDRSEWVQNTAVISSNNVLHRVAYTQAGLRFLLDVPSTVSPSALLTLFSPQNNAANGLSGAVLSGIGPNAHYISEVWGGNIRLNGGGTPELFLDITFYEAIAPGALQGVSLAFDVDVTGYPGETLRVSFDLPVEIPADIPSIAVSPHEARLTAGVASDVVLTVTVNNIPDGTHSVTLIDSATVSASNPVGLPLNVNGVYFDDEIEILNGVGTFIITGNSSTSAGNWGILFDFNLGGDLYVYYPIRLVIQNQPGGGGGGPSESEPTPSPSPTPTPPSGNTTIIVINNVNKVIVNKNVTNTKIVTVIREAKEKGERPKIEIELEDEEDGIKVGGGDVKDIIENDGVLIVINNNVRIEIGAGEMSNWNINVDSEIIISLRPVRDEEVKDKIKNKPSKPGGAQTPEELLNLLVSVVVEVNIVIDGVASDDARPMLTVDLSGKNLTDEEKAMLQGVFFFLADPDDPDSLTYVLVEGVLDGDLFMVPAIAVDSAFFSLMMIEIEVGITINVSGVPNVVRLQLGTTVVVADGQPQPSMDVAPFLADPNDPESLMLPIRAINEIFGGSVTWNSQLNMVVVVNIQLNVSFTFRIDQPLPDGGGETEVVNGRTFVPRRFMADMMGINVNYDPDTDAIYVVNPCGDGSVCGTVCPPCSSGGGNNHANCFALRDRDHPQFMEFCGCTC